MTLNLASPADAATIVKKPVKVKSTLPAVVPAPTPSAAVSRAPARAVPTQYVVVEGDTISGIGGRFGLSTASVLALNGLGWSSMIFPGQKLTLTVHAAPPAAVPARKPVAAEITRYKVKSGDTISGIAAAHGLTTAAVLSANGLGRASIIFPGQAIVLPNAAPAATSTGASAPAPAAAPAPAPVKAAAPAAAPGPAPSSYTIARGDTITTVAATAGLPVQAILDANGLGWSSIIYPGQVLKIPTITRLTAEMRGNAQIIVAVGRRAGVSDRGLVVALAAAAQESGLRNVQYGDRDSLGLFQQRPSAGWGSADQVLDPVRASRAFFGGADNPNRGVTRGLLDIRGWESLTVTQAAQAVQISAYPNHYAKWEASARVWVAELD
ncbi:muramidase family protein [Cryobacterium tagatosivorans]|uniref:LysM peptidoglycan-binding domain-containing protein n=1 Tax=Cryobacterium tagatosivorans TaxID=1259199 RepID=A0A4R8UEQ5_9MICO|nr:LysM peptidoglycan-binding domain-containing protein [Cryobacterium tagatosivorans]